MKTTEQKIEELEKQLQGLKAEVAKQNQPKFKKGDFIACDGNSFQYHCVAIASGKKGEQIFGIADNKVEVPFMTSMYENFRLATESEKQQLIDKLRENGKDWDAEKMEIVDYRWRAEKDKFYYYVFSDGIVDEYCDEYCTVDDTMYNLGNYFKTKELAEAAAEKVKDLLLTLKHS